MNLHNETQREKNLESERVFVSQRSVHTTDTDLFRRGYRDLRCCGVPVSLIFFVLVAVNKFPILRCCGDLKLYGVQYF